MHSLRTLSTRVLRVLTDTALDFLALVLPVVCSGCGAPDRSVCRTCAEHLRGPVLVRRLSGFPVFSAAAYDDPVSSILRSFKDGGRIDASRALGRSLRRVLAEGMAHSPDPRTPVVVPVPTTTAAMRRRGFAPVEQMLRTGGIRVSKQLRVGRRVRDQSELGAEARADNLAGAFVARRSLRGTPCILVDDVVTTGATLAEAARALTGAGAEVLFAVTVAATPLRRAPERDAVRTGP